jgi:hypothetical protein
LIKKEEVSMSYPRRWTPELISHIINLREKERLGLKEIAIRFGVCHQRIWSLIKRGK